MKRFNIFILISALVMLLAAGATVQAAQQKTGDQYCPRVASFDVLVDYSGSMMMRHNKTKIVKMVMAKDVLKRMAALTPELAYDGGLHTFAPVGEVLPVGRFNQASLGKAVDALATDLEIFGRLTPMGDGMAALNPMFKNMPRKTAVLLVTDGYKNIGIDPVEEARQIYDSNPDLVIHIISLADTVKGQKTLDAIAALNDKTVMVAAADLKDDAAINEFLMKTLYTSCDVIVLRSVQFAFDSSKIDNASAAILDEVAGMLKKGSDKIQIDGHTCSIGTDAYNMGLSERRAAAVKTYLVQRGISADRLFTKGYGESKPKYDNGTAEGRRLNRRAELSFK